MKIEVLKGEGMRGERVFLEFGKGTKVYLIGAGGTGMGSLGSLLKDSGFNVRGSDLDLYPPMSDFLKEKGIEVLEGWHRGNLDPPPDLVVIGNAVSKDNPEARRVIEDGLPFTSFPSALFQFFMKGKRRLVVAGTHGKTTCASLLSWTMHRAGRSPSFLVGGIPMNFGFPSLQGHGEYFIVEGDEYDTSFFDRGSKFLHFRPDLLLLTGVEFDHADIFPDIEGYRAPFEILLSGMKRGSKVITHSGKGGDTLPLPEGVQRITYGDEGADRVVNLLKEWEEGIEFTLSSGGREGARFFLPLHGEFNAMNAAGCAVALEEAGLSHEEMREGFSSFRGVQKRAEILYRGRYCTLILDFAHHPTAVRLTLKGLKRANPGRHLTAIFEPRTQTSRRRVFQKDYPHAFEYADTIVSGPLFAPERIPPEERFSPEELVSRLREMGKDAHYIPEISGILDFVRERLFRNTVIVVMTPGSFSGLPSLLIEEVRRSESPSTQSIPP